MVVRNRLFNTRPIALHNHGRKSDEARELFETACSAIRLLSGSVVDAKCISFISWSNYPFKGSFEMSLDQVGLKCNILGRQVLNWSHYAKLALNLDFLNSCTTEFVMGADACDVVLLGDPAIILDYFLALDGCKMLFNAGCKHWPPETDTDAFEKSVSTGPYQFLNGGLWIAQADFARQMHEEAILVHPSRMEDQSVYKRLYQRFYPEIRIDSQCVVFQTLQFEGTLGEVLEAEESQL